MYIAAYNAPATSDRPTPHHHRPQSSAGSNCSSRTPVPLRELPGVLGSGDSFTTNALPKKAIAGSALGGWGRPSVPSQVLELNSRFTKDGPCTGRGGSTLPAPFNVLPETFRFKALPGVASKFEMFMGRDFVRSGLGAASGKRAERSCLFGVARLIGEGTFAPLNGVVSSAACAVSWAAPLAAVPRGGSVFSFSIYMTGTIPSMTRQNPPKASQTLPGGVAGNPHLQPKIPTMKVRPRLVT
mmetsp:Transcript_15420/g.23534  ORF Transcript_15420/g.23534 Transcript_15420/m.23534 type:complete len:241 (-) Transcript_15420:7-729(-)